MRRKLTQQEFELNSNTVVIIKTKQKGADLYESKVALVHQTVSEKPLVLRTHDDIVELVKNIPLEDDQQSFFDDNQTTIGE